MRIPGGGGWCDLFTDADGRLGVGWYLGAKVPWRCGGCLSIRLYRTTYLSETQVGVSLFNTRFLSLMNLSQDLLKVLFPRNGMIGINSLYFLVFSLRHLRLKQPLFSARRILSRGSSSP